MVATGPSRGHVPDDHKMQANTANTALMSADLVIFIGQYCMPPRGEYAFGPGAKVIRVHPEQEDLGRNWPVDLGIVSDERMFLEALADTLPRKKRPQWVSELAASREAFDKQNDKLYQLGMKYSQQTGYLHPAVIGQGVHQFFHKGEIDPRQTVLTTGGFTTGKFMGRWAAGYRPGQLIAAPYQYGAIGPDIGMAVGAGAAVQSGVGPQAPYKGAPVLCVTSDAGTAYSLFEMDTANKYRIPMIVIVYNNNAWGVFGSAARHPQAMHMYLFQEHLRYDKIAEGLGVRGEYVQTPEQFTDALARSYKLASSEGASTVINCQGIKEFTSARAYPPGAPQGVEPGRAAVAH
ncbi:MAG: thiamine pyrophosphate-binding protein [Halieaceae bacterium]|jgi:acetolactate synthase I/II/III large subunit|nr:thiamine pyrophosphate-binding protein [Halieaceae bacterium]